MNNVEQKTGTDVKNTTRKYLALMAVISVMENRLVWLELVYLSLNVLFFLFAVKFIPALLDKTNALININVVIILFCLIIGIAVNTHWIASAMRTQLKLKLRYFQARFLERKLNCPGEYIFSDEANFFDPDIRHLESPDEKEILKYPASGLIRMDGLIGAARPRFFSWMMPSLFIIIYWIVYFWVLTSIK